MSVKDNFTPDEWFKVMTGPGRAGAAVVAARPSRARSSVQGAHASSDAGSGSGWRSMSDERTT